MRGSVDEDVSGVDGEKIMNSEMKIVDAVIDAANAYYSAAKRDQYSRYRSWENCYIAFGKARENFLNPAILENLSLQLACYLASWGMYRGSSFLLQKDYHVHMDAVVELMKEKYHPLFGISCKDLKQDSMSSLLEELSTFLRNYYNHVRASVRSVSSDISDVLITKILMGTLGCVPAYDRYFCFGIKHHHIAVGKYGMKSILMVADFYEKHEEKFEQARTHFFVGDSLYPQMKLLDMGFWKIGLQIDEKNNNK